jgi:hypothetical protein
MRPDASVIRPSGTGDGTPLACDKATGCQICNGSLPEEHEHVLDTHCCAVMCLCLACSEVFRRPRIR